MDQCNSKNILRACKNSECCQEQSNPINDCNFSCERDFPNSPVLEISGFSVVFIAYDKTLLTSSGTFELFSQDRDRVQSLLRLCL